MKQEGWHWKIHGKVQGVWYRASAKQEADRLGLKGHVSNNPDGTVQITVYGNEEDLNKFKSWCMKGPQNAQVSFIEAEEIPYKELPSFEIRK